MKIVDKWNRHEIVVNEDMVVFVKVPCNLKQFFHDGVLHAIFLDAVLVFLRPGPSVCENPRQQLGTESHNIQNLIPQQ
jgi:hypothetical protein